MFNKVLNTPLKTTGQTASMALHKTSVIQKLITNNSKHVPLKIRLKLTPSNGTKYSRMDQVKFVDDSLWKIWNDMICLSEFFEDCPLQKN